MHSNSAIVPVLLLLAVLFAGCDAATIRAFNAEASAKGTNWMPRNGMGGNGGGA
jgi:hypothetical protein